jgi:hypothetical protein
MARPGLEHHLEAAPGERLAEALAVAAHVGRRLVAVADAEAAAQVEVLELDAFLGELGHQLEHALERLVHGRGLEDLRADVAADADHADVRPSRRRAGRRRARARAGMPNLLPASPVDI